MKHTATPLGHRLLAWVLAVGLALSLAAGTLPAQAAVATSGDIGTNGAIHWAIENGTLTLTGTGPIPDYEDKSWYTRDQVPTPWFPHSKNIHRVVIGEGITGVGAHAFADLENVTDISLPDSLTFLNAAAFRRCAITGLRLPEGLSSIGESAFSSCSRLKDLVIPDTVTSIQGFAFSGTALETVYIPDSVKSLCVTGEIFSNCEALHEVRYPRRKIGVAYNYAIFVDCPNLTTAYLPGTVYNWKDLKSLPFWNCPNLKDIYFGGTREDWAACMEGVEEEFYGRMHPYEDELWTPPTIHYNAPDMEKPAQVPDLPDDPAPVPDRTIPTPQLDRAEYQKDAYGNGGVLLSWRIFPEGTEYLDPPWEEFGYAADGYVIYRREGEGPYQELVRTDTNEFMAYRDETVETGKTYAYQVACYYEDQAGQTSEEAEVLAYALDVSGFRFSHSNPHDRIKLVEDQSSYLSLALTDPLPTALLQADGNTAKLAACLSRSGGANTFWLPTPTWGNETLIVEIPWSKDFLLPATGYTLSLCDMDRTEVLWQTGLQSEPHRFGFFNSFPAQEQAFSLEDCTALFGEKAGKKLYDSDKLEPDGLCFGMALGVSLVNHRDLALSDFGVDALYEVTGLDHPMTGQYASVGQLVKRLHLTQFRKDVQDQITAHKGDFTGLIEAVRAYQTGGPMPLLYLAEPGYIHTLPLYDFQVLGSTLRLYFQEPNSTGWFEDLTVTGYTLGGDAVWDYGGTHGGSAGGDDTFLTYVTVTDDLLRDAASPDGPPALAELKEPVHHVVTRLVKDALGLSSSLPAGQTAAAWSSSNPSVAVVDENGVVTTLAPGAATITAAADDGTALALFDLTVADLTVLDTAEEVITGDVLSTGVVQIENRGEEGVPVVLLGACYDGEGRMTSLSRLEKTLAPGRQFLFPTLKALPEAAVVKYFLLSDDGALTPLIPVVEKTGPWI